MEDFFVIFVFWVQVIVEVQFEFVFIYVVEGRGILILENEWYIQDNLNFIREVIFNKGKSVRFIFVGGYMFDIVFEYVENYFEDFIVFG